MKTKIIKIRDIKIDEKFYPREKLVKSVAEQYARAMKEGEIFPLSTVAFFQNEYLLIDGRHRIEAKSINGEEFVNCEVIENFTNKNDIYLASIRSNLKHGKQLSTQDKLKIAFTLKDLKYDSEAISNLLHLSKYIIKRISFTKIDKMTINKGIKGWQTIKDSPKRDEVKFTNLIDEKEEQIAELEVFLYYLQNSKIRKDVEEIKSLLVKIDTEIKRLVK